MQGPGHTSWSVGAGVTLAVAALGILAWVAWQDPAAGRVLGLAMAMEFGVGREATIPVALAGGAPAWAVAVASMAQNMALAALVAPLLELLLARWQRQDHFLARRLRRLQAAADRRQRWIGRWGPWGLFGFMVVPFLTNGPLVAVLAGRVAGLSGWRLWVPVTGGVVTMAAAWTLGHDRLLRSLGDVGPALPLAIFVFMVLVLVAASWLDEVRARRHDAATGR